MYEEPLQRLSGLFCLHALGTEALRDGPGHRHSPARSLTETCEKFQVPLQSRCHSCVGTTVDGLKFPDRAHTPLQSLGSGHGFLEKVQHLL